MTLIALLLDLLKKILKTERRMHILGMLVFIEFFLLITVTRGFSNSRRRATEWDVDVKLIFPYPCENTEVTLQFRHRVPFFSSLNPNSLNLHRDQMRRFIVKSMQERGNCFLELVISPVMKRDQGVYILLDDFLDSIQRVWLQVETPPAKAHCKWDGMPYVGKWVKLICNAVIGSKQGQIQCFQRGMEMPPLGAPSESDTILTQTFLVVQSHDRDESSDLVFCCSSFITHPKVLCLCNEFVWDPLTNRGSSENISPCPLTSVPSIGRTMMTDQPKGGTPPAPAQSKVANPSMGPTHHDHEDIDANDQQRFRHAWFYHRAITLLAPWFYVFNCALSVILLLLIIVSARLMCLYYSWVIFRNE